MAATNETVAKHVIPSFSKITVVCKLAELCYEVADTLVWELLSRVEVEALHNCGAGGVLVVSYQLNQFSEGFVLRLRGRE